jgi:hypothetical protein
MSATKFHTHTKQQPKETLHKTNYYPRILVYNNFFTYISYIHRKVDNVLPGIQKWSYVTARNQGTILFKYRRKIHMARMGEERGAYRVLVGKPEGKRPLARPRRRWVDNIRMDLQEVGCGYVDWTGLAQDRNRWRTLVSAVMDLRVP